MFHVYVLEATARSGRRTIHVGIAKDPHRRMKDHANGRVKATRGRLIRLVGDSSAMKHGDALRLEAALKKKSRTEKLKWAKEAQDEQQRVGGD